VPVHCGARFSANARALLGVAGRLDPLPFAVILGPGDCLLAVLGGLEHQMRDHLRGERGTAAMLSGSSRAVSTDLAD
jgi:hypothetical protein